MKGLIKKVSFGIIILTIVLLAIFNKQIVKTIRINQAKDPEVKVELTYSEITKDDEKVSGTDNILFSAFFLRDLDGDGIASKLRGTCNNVDGKPDTLYINFNTLGDGKLKNAKIELNQTNFQWNTEIVKDNIVANSYSGNVTSIVFKDEIIGGSQKLFSGSIYPNIQNNINNYTGTNSVTLTGTYVDDDEVEIQIEKTIELTVDWYGITKTIVNKNNLLQTKDIKTLINNETVKIKFDAVITETEEKLILNKQVAEFAIPKLNGYEAITAYASTARASSTYNAENKKLTITNSANVKRDGEVQVALARSNTYEIVIEYPMEAYEAANGGNISLDIPIKGYNYGYNNQNSAFSNPYISSDSNIITVVYKADVQDNGSTSGTNLGYSRGDWAISISVGDYVYNSTTGGEYRISQDTIIERYNGSEYEDTDDTYTVRWNAFIYEPNRIANITLEEQELGERKRVDEFTRRNRTSVSMKNYEKIIGVSFKNATEILGSNGFIKLYNGETGTLIETFTRDNWNRQYKIKTDDLKSIKVETSAPIGRGWIEVDQIKKIDDSKVVEDFTKEEFQTFKYIFSYLRATANARGTFSDGDSTSHKSASNSANYEGIMSVQNVSIYPQEISNQETRSVNIYINTKSVNNFESEWINGVFLLEFPEDLLDVSVKNITTSKESVKIKSWSYFEQDGKKYIKIYTDNANEETYSINITADITANPLSITKAETLELYAYNPNCNNYYSNAIDKYDLDEDMITQDLVGYSTTTFTTIAPSGLLTAEYITNFDENNSVTIAPNIAEIEKSDGARTATVNIELIDSYAGTISDVSILGRIPYEGNRYILVDKDLKSEYTAQITGPITMSNNHENDVSVYYSSNGTATKDINDENNGWINAEAVTDWTTIKSYLIDFGDYVFTESTQETFSYEVKIPSGLGYESATYSNHAVFYSLDTENGKLEMQTEPNRVGMQIVGKYTLNITKNKTGQNEVLVPGATYRVSTKDLNDNIISKIAVSDTNGNITFNDIYIGREYTLEEISSPSDYLLTEGKIVFNTSVNDQGELVFEVKHDQEYGETKDFKETPTITLDNNENFVVNTKVEDEAKYTITINKTNTNGEPLNNTIFKFGTEERTKNYVTNSNGKIVIPGLELNKEYIIQEIRSDGYYVDENEKAFKIIRDDNGLKIVTEDDVLSNAVIENIDGKNQTQVTFNIENEKIPTYKLQIFKTNKPKDGEAEVPLEGAYFRIASVDTQRQEEYRTNENGIIEVDGLYLNVDGKNISGAYEIQETRAPSGYINSVDLIKIEVKGVYNEETQKYDLNLNVENEDQLESVKSITVESDIVKIVVQDKPLFQLTKVDSETGEVLSNVQFILYKVEGDETTDFAKDEYGNYLGIPNDQGDYIVTTDANGTISLPLPDGKYCLVEVTYPEGYQIKDEAEYFIIGDSEDKNSNEDEDKTVKRVIEINYIEDLVEISERTKKGDNYHDAVIKLMRDLDFESADSYRSGSINWNLVNAEGSEGFTPIGGYDTRNNFSGIFDGQNHTISKLYVNTKYYEYIGLFGRIKDAEIKNLTVKGKLGNPSEHKYSNAYAGGIVGYFENSKINNCSSDVAFSIAENIVSYVGGIVGSANSGEISDCNNIGNIEVTKNNCIQYYSNTFTGGIVGNISYSTIKRCYNKGNIRGYNHCTNRYEEALLNTYTGGIAGNASNSGIENSYNTGDIYSYAYTVGFIEGEQGHDYYVQHAVAMAGGIVGVQEDGFVNNCYNVGNIAQSGVSTSANYGIAGKGTSSEKNNCYNLTGKGISNETGVTQCSEEHMKSDEFVQELGSRYWTKEINQNSEYPIIRGDSTEILTIDYIEDLVELAIDVNRGNTYTGKTVTLNRSLDFNDASSYRENVVDTSLTSGDTGFLMIGNNERTFFGGTFDGNNNVISNLYIKSNKDSVGLFGYIKNAKIKNLGLTGQVKVISTTTDGNFASLVKNVNAGSIVGNAMYSTINNCYTLCTVENQTVVTNTKNSSSQSTSTASSIIRTGGIVGIAQYTTISNCYSTGNITGYSTANCRNTSSYEKSRCTSTSITGGIVGYARYSGIENCYNRGKVHSNTNASDTYTITGYNTSRSGGIVGDSVNANITRVYNTGNVQASSSASTSSSNKSGGITGEKDNYTTIKNAFYLSSISITGTNTNIGETRTDSQMKSTEFVNELGSRYWTLEGSQGNDGYPVIENEVGLITEINYIEDLIQLAEDVNSGIKYDGCIVKLMRNLDFRDASSYRSGVVNQNLIEESVSEGFTPIGYDEGISFSGIFEGQDYEIRNIYINTDKKYVGLFGYVDGGKIKNLGLTGEINGNAATYTAGIAAYIKNNSIISNCYNSATITGKSVTGGVTGFAEDSIIKYSNNNGSVESSASRKGGIAGGISNCTVECSYNKGNVSGAGHAGGIVGYSEKYSIIKDAYNTGKITGNLQVGGIAGYAEKTKIINTYNIGDLKSEGTKSDNGYVGTIIGKNDTTTEINKCYYLETIKVEGKEVFEKGISITNENIGSKEFFNELNVDNVWIYRKGKNPILVNKQVKNIMGKATELTINNTIKKFKITTDIKEINNVKGGSISGEDEKPYETVNYAENNTKAINIIPDEGYIINSITINDKDIIYTPNADGSYTIDVGYFTNIDENKSIIVSFIPEDKIIYINKTDKDGNHLKDAEFIIESNNDTPVIGPLTNNNENYYFVDNEGVYVSNNTGIHNTCANSYMQLDLTNYQGKYTVTVNAQVSSQSYYDYGYVTITKTTTAPAYNDTEGRLIYISGSVSKKDYSVELEGGSDYYIHLGYYKNASTNSGTDCFTVNSIKIEPIVETYTAKTNEEGVAIVSVAHLGKYKIKETKAPEHYILNEEEKNIELVSGESVQTIEIENKRKTEIVVHHYLEGTTSKVAEDDILWGNPGETYEARPHTDLNKLSVVENQEYYAGTFEEEGAEFAIYYKAAPVKLTIHHYYEGTEKSLVDDKTIYQDSEVVFTNIAEYQVITNASYALNTNEDYISLKENNEFIGVSSKNMERNILSIEDSFEYNTDTELTYYYRLKEVNYKVQYFYNSVLDEEETENKTELQNVTVESYEDKCKEGYKLDYAKALDENGEETEMPLILKNNEEYNIINVYYITDDIQQKEIGYIVEYYKDGIKVENDTQIKTAKVQVLENSIAVDKDDINTVDKYFGYKIDSTNPDPIPDRIENGGVIKIYYVLDEDAKKELSYTVEYYKDSVKIEDDTIIEKVIVHVLEPNTLQVKKEDINIVDKYEGCTCTTVTPSPIPDIIETGSVIKVYYTSVLGYKFEKQWNSKTEEEANLYRTTYTLYKNVNGTESAVKNTRRIITATVNDANSTNSVIEYPSTSTVVTVNIVGNGTVEFKNLPRYENGNEVTYLIKETTIAKLASNGTSWTYPSMSNYTISYNDNHDGVNRFVENREKFKITTEIAKNVSNERIGGTITGTYTAAYPESNGKKYVETAEEGSTPENDIVIQPDEGYFIANITINGKDYSHVPDENGNVTISKESFENIKENKHIIVRFMNPNNMIKIIKEDDVGNRLQGATFFASNKSDYKSYIGTITPDEDSENYFIEGEYGVYESNNEGIDDSTAKSYSNIDLTNFEGEFQLIIDVTISSESGYDTGYIELENVTTEEITDIGYPVSGYEENIIYENTLYGGNYYRVHYYYSKDGSAEDYDDKFYINNVSLFYGNEYTVSTNENGEAYIETRDESLFNIVETEAPNGYIKNDETKTATATNAVTFINQRMPRVVVHHYYKNPDGTYTTNKIAEDEILFGEIDEEYETNAKEDLDGLIREKDNEETIEPSNKTGTFKAEDTIVTYYYEIRPIELTIHHYKEETTDRLKEDEKIIGIPAISFPTDGTYSINKVLIYDLNENTNYKDLISKRSFVKVINAEDELNIADNFSYNSNAEITYYYGDTLKSTYTVNYLEKGTNREIATQKTSDEIDVGTEINIENEKIDIDGYVYDSSTPEELTIGVNSEDNGINLYYTKRNNLSYVIHYREQGVDGEEGKIAEDKNIDQQVFGDTVIENAIDIPGYTKVNPIEVSIEITTGTNEATFYYIKQTNLTYTVNYLEKNTNTAIKEAKQVNNVTFKQTITSADEIISIYGYDYDSADKETLSISATEENVINLYYTKKAASVLIHYYIENTTTRVPSTTEEEVADITLNGLVGDEYTTFAATNVSDKYELVSENPENYRGNYTEQQIVVTYYYRLKDYGYTVEYYYDNLKDDSKTEVGTETYGKQITEYIDKVITGYVLNTTENLPLTISDNVTENVIKVYYVKGDYDYTVEYYYDNVKDSTATYTNSAKFESVINSYPEKSKDGYRFDKDEGKPLTISEKAEDNIIKVYYVARTDLSYIVNYLNKDTNEAIKTQKYEENVSYGQVIASANEVIQIYGYDYDSVDKEILTISTTAANNVINIYYTKKNAKATVKYMIEGTTTEIAEAVEYTGKVGDSYESNEKEIEGYTFVRSTNNTSGELTEEDINVVYYYQPNTYVTVRYLEKDTNEVLSPEVTLNGFTGKDFETVKANIANYTYVNVDGPTSGKMTQNPIITTYYYLQNTKARVEYIDKTDGRILDYVEKTGLVGDEFVTEAKEFENYILIESPDTTTVNMAKDMITLKYYYAYANASLIVRYINVITGAVIESEIENGKTAGDTYRTTAKNIEGYELVGELNGHDYTPQNATGTYTNETITVDYYYIRKASVTAKYIDKTTGEKIADDVIIQGHEGDPYQTQKKTIEGYALDNVEGNTNSTMSITTDSEGNVVTNKEVIYYYKKASSILVNHIDVKTNEIITTERMNGYEGEIYSTTPKTIESYDLVGTKLPSNKEGRYTRSEQVVNYYYIRKIMIKVLYQEENGTELDRINIEGHEGDEYSTEEKTIKGYKLIEVPKNAEGVMSITKDANGNDVTEIVVIYKYKKLIPADVIEKYIDINTKEIVKETIHKGEIGNKYEITPKPIEGYTLITEDEEGKSILPNNNKGSYTTTKVEIVYYVALNTIVRVQYINLITGEKMTDDVIIEGYEGKEYMTEAQKFDGYELTGIPENAKGIMKVTIDENGNKIIELVVKYYYAERLDGKLPQTNESNSKQIILIAIPFIVLINLILVNVGFKKKSKEENLKIETHQDK